MSASNITRRAAIRAAMAGAATIAAGGVGVAGAPPQPAGGGPERVQGIGGFFFRAKDPRKLAEWYESNLGVGRTPTNYNQGPWRTDAGAVAFQPFKEDMTYFGDARLQWMINFRVGNLDRMVAQLREKGIAVEVDKEAYPNGRFARLNDPEGNPIQLWQPAG